MIIISLFVLCAGALFMSFGLEEIASEKRWYGRARISSYIFLSIPILFILLGILSILGLLCTENIFALP